MNASLAYFLRRLSEPSTAAGLGVLAMLFGIPQFKVDAVVQVVGAVAGTAAIFLPERKAAPAAPEEANAP